MDSVERKLIKEVLNADTDALAEIIDANPNRVNFISQCGESPLGIAIYRRHVEMMNILLEAGSNPKHINKDGDTSVHIAARVGHIEILTILHETGMCNLLIKNVQHKTALDIARETPNDTDVNLLHLFGEWNETVALEVELQCLIVGRRVCSKYLEENAAIDTIAQRQTDIDTIIKTNAYDNRARRCMQDEQHHATHHFQIPILIPEYPLPPTSIDSDLYKDSVSINGNFNDARDVNEEQHYSKVWSQEQRDRLRNTKSDVILVSRGVFVKDYVNKLIARQVQDAK